MDHLSYIKEYLNDSLSVKNAFLEDQQTLGTIAAVVTAIVSAFAKGNKVILAGNGGSAADAQHIAAEFVSRFLFDRPGLPAIALTTDTSILTAIGNDYGYEQVFSRQLQAQGQKGDIFIGISTSGESENVIRAVNTAKEEKITTVVLCGEKGKLKSMVDYAICVPSSSTPHIQECHICIGHMICGMIESQIFADTR